VLVTPLAVMPDFAATVIKRTAEYTVPHLASGEAWWRKSRENCTARGLAGAAIAVTKKAENVKQSTGTT